MDPVDVTDRATDDVPAVVFAKHQPEYIPLPVTVHRSDFKTPPNYVPALVYPQSLMMSEWKLTDAERAAIARGENIRLWVWTFGQKLQPVQLEVANADAEPCPVDMAAMDRKAPARG